MDYILKKSGFTSNGAECTRNGVESQEKGSRPLLSGIRRINTEVIITYTVSIVIFF